ncbi:MAG: HAMP domain-containing histidine kinase [Clostridia bacterium]|nr:HAMP domain-containing histidine kinase [Clostridia bacterium]
MTVFTLGAVTSAVFTYRNIREQDRNMEKAAQKIASMLEEVPANYSFFVGTVMEGAIETVKETIDCDVLIMNRSGALVQSTLQSGATVSLPKEAVDAVLSGETYSRQKVFIREQGNAYTVGVPIRNDQKIVGGVFVTARQVRIGSEFGGILPSFLMWGVLVLILAVVILYFVTRQITRPLYEMAIAARSYSKGDFSRRISVAPEGELGTLAATFNQMAENLDRLEATRREFIADVSHELRTPMTTIGGFIDGILDGTIPPEAEQKYLLLVSEEVKRLTRMVNNLLDVAKIQSGKITYQMEPFDLTELSYRVMLTMEDRIAERGIELTHTLPEESIYVLGDHDAIHRVIYNLMDNAVKFTPDQGKIHLGIFRRDGKAYFSVRNSGAGIPEQEVGKIFERFYKTDKSRGENRKGVGLGLYMVKNIIEAHGEDLYVSSEEGVFAEFSFSLKETKEIGE